MRISMKQLIANHSSSLVPFTRLLAHSPIVHPLTLTADLIKAAYRSLSYLGYDELPADYLRHADARPPDHRTEYKCR